MLKKLVDRFGRPYLGLFVIGLVFQLGAGLAALWLPTINARIIDDGIAKGNIDVIWSSGGIMLLITLIQITCQVIAVWIGARIAMGMGRAIREAIFGKVLTFGAQEMRHFGAPTLVTRNTNDVQQVQMFILMVTLRAVSAPITMIGGVIMALRADVGMSWLMVAAIIIMVTGTTVIIRHVTPLYRTMQRRIDDLNRVLREQITGVRVVRAFVQEKSEQRRFEKTNQELTDISLRVGDYMAILFPFIGLVMHVGSVAVVWVGAGRIASGDLEVGQLIAFMSYLTQILLSVMFAMFVVVMYPRASVSSGRIEEVLEQQPSVVPPKQPVTTMAEPGHVSFEDVSFSYPGAEAPVLCDVSINLAPGTVTGIIGSTGSGKSTLINLIPRLYDATEGVVLVGGTNVKALDPEVLWNSISLVPQKSYLFTGTVASNVRYGNPDASEEEIWRALTIAQAADFVHEMDQQLEAPIAQGGTNVSGGQRQRLAIARALIKPADIYIFDDSFSALDAATDARLRAALRTECRESSVVIVGQRIATIKDADDIIVIDDGKIVGQGTHEQLLNANETYQEIVSSQLTPEEAH